MLATHGVIAQDAEAYRISGTMFRDWFDAHAPVATDDVFEILNRLSARIEGLKVTEHVRRRAQDHVGRARNLLGRGDGPDPGTAKKGGADALRRLWDVVKGLQDATALAKTCKSSYPTLGRSRSGSRT